MMICGKLTTHREGNEGFTVLTNGEAAVYLDPVDQSALIDLARAPFGLPACAEGVLQCVNGTTLVLEFRRLTGCRMRTGDAA